MLLTGDAGGGKSYTVDTIVLATDLLNLGHVATTAHLGIAAVIINGHTLCRLFTINSNKIDKLDNTDGYIQPLSNSSLEALRQTLNYEDLSLLVIDEISAVDPRFLPFISARLQQVYGNDEPFGGVSVLFVGDFRQLFPVGPNIPQAMVAYAQETQKDDPVQKKIQNILPDNADETVQLKKKVRRNIAKTVAEHSKYKKTKKQKVQKLLREKIKCPLVKRGCELFASSERHHLTTQHRADDPEHLEFILRLAEANNICLNDFKNYEPLTQKDVQHEDPEKNWSNAPYIVASNRERFNICYKKSLEYAKKHGVHLYRWRSKMDELSWDGKPEKPEDQQEAIDKDPTFWQWFVPGIHVYLNQNINVGLGMANGTR